MDNTTLLYLLVGFLLLFFLFLRNFRSAYLIKKSTNLLLEGMKRDLLEFKNIKDDIYVLGFVVNFTITYCSLIGMNSKDRLSFLNYMLYQIYGADNAVHLNKKSTELLYNRDDKIIFGMKEGYNAAKYLIRYKKYNSMLKSFILYTRASSIP